MNKKISVFLMLLLFAAVFSHPANAQIFDKLKRKVKSQIEKNDPAPSPTPDSNKNNGDNGNNSEKSDEDDEQPTKNKQSDKIIFSNAPLAPDARKSTQTDFEFGKPIYGRVFLPVSYGEAFSKTELNDEKPRLQIYIYSVSNDFGQEIIKNYENGFRKIYADEYNKKYIDFVLMPDAAAAKNYAIESDLGIRGLFSMDDFAGKKVKLTVNVEPPNDNGGKSPEMESSFTVNYTNLNRRALKDYQPTYDANRKIAETTAQSHLTQVGIAQAKTLPLPKFFSKPQGPGYTATSNAQLISMSKATFGITQLSMFRIDKNDGAEYVVVKNALGIPLKMVSERHFYFVYQDPQDGACKVRGGHLEKNYLGGGKYGAPIVVGSLFALESGEDYPADNEGHFIVDCAKAK